MALDTKEEVDAMYAKAIELGAGSEDGEPGQKERPFMVYVHDWRKQVNFFNFDV